MHRMAAPTVVTQTPWTQKGTVLRWRKRSRPFDFLMNGIDGFIRHKTGRNAALLAHYGFLSVFPLLVVMTTILGFLLEGDSRLRADITHSAFANIPFIGQQLQSDPSKLHGNIVVLIVGLATALWAGTKAFVAAQHGMNDIWEIPEAARPTLARARGRALLAIGVVGVAQVASAVATGIIAVSGVSWLNRILLAIAAVAVNVGVLMAAYRVLTARRLTAQQLLPGSIGAGVAFSVLQVIGTTIVKRGIKNASPVYGSYATVIALLTWLTLHAMISLLGAEANAGLHRREHATRR